MFLRPMLPSSPPKPAPANQIRTEINRLLAAYAGTAGVGSDAYASERMNHPMAEAKYLMAIAALRSADLLSEQKFVELATKPVQRLQRCKIGTEVGPAWGLGFAWRDLPENEPFLITTSLVVEALAVTSLTLPDNKSIKSEFFEGFNTLTNWCTQWTAVDEPSGAKLPFYSPGIPEPVYNSAAYAAGVLRRYDRAGGNSATTGLTEQILRSVANQRRIDIGWHYSAKSGIVDLLHQCYLLEALRGFVDDAERERQLRDTISVFYAGDQYFDKCANVGHHFPPIDSHVPILRKYGDSYYRFPAPCARLWSLGELLRVIANIIPASTNTVAWKRVGQQLVDRVLLSLAEGPDREFPRQTMHALHGLTAYLAALRGSQTRPKGE